VRFVTVENNVRLEVLDWGGSGRPIVLLAGLGNTAHIFDDFAEKLSTTNRVYGITRRGFGASGRPDSGYDEQRLADDVLHVLDSLAIVEPVLAGHSIAGDELTAIGTQHSKRVAGLVYLDAAADPTDDYTEYEALREKLPAVMKNPPTPSGEDRRSFQAFHDWQVRTSGSPFPESELRNLWMVDTDGSMGTYKVPPSISDAVRAGGQKRDYSHIRVPILMFTWFPLPVEQQLQQYPPKDAQERVAIEAVYAADASWTNRRIQSVQSAGVGARVVKLPGANHYLFISNEAEVLREMRTFVRNLP
jgi:pimeloyl-ACP methyl ester carboxylesterase